MRSWARCFWVTAALLGSAVLCQAQDSNPKKVQWHVTLTPANPKPGDDVEVIFSADISKGWILYSSDFHLDIGPLPTRFTFDANPALSPVGAIRPVEPKHKKDRSLGGEYTYFAGHAEFRQKAKVVAPLNGVSGRIDGQTCFEESGLCELFRETFSTGT